MFLLLHSYFNHREVLPYSLIAIATMSVIDICCVCTGPECGIKFVPMHFYCRILSILCCKVNNFGCSKMHNVTCFSGSKG